MGTKTGIETAQTSSALFRTKSIDRLRAESGGETALKRTLGPWSLVALGIGAIIGAGLFVRTADAIAQRSGPSVTLAFILAGVGCAFAGHCLVNLHAIDFRLGEKAYQRKFEGARRIER